MNPRIGAGSLIKALCQDLAPFLLLALLAREGAESQLLDF